MNQLPAPIQSVMDALAALPGIGPRSAERLTLTLLRNQQGIEEKLGSALLQLKTGIMECPQCCFYMDQIEPATLCPLCTKTSRSDRTLCVVAEVSDVLALERTHSFGGRYHVLHGVISPMNRVRPEDVRISHLLTRIAENPPDEIIFGLPANTEGEATSLYIMEKLKAVFSGTVTRLSQGIPSGGNLDFLDAGTLSRAMIDRRSI